MLTIGCTLGALNLAVMGFGADLSAVWGPLFQAVVSGRNDDWNEESTHAAPGVSSEHRAAVGLPYVEYNDSPPIPESLGFEWSVNMVKAPSAWKHFPQDVAPGQGIVIGHPDTGYTRHPEIKDSLLVKRGHDYVDGDDDPEDDLENPSPSNPLASPGHGTTSTIIVSPKGARFRPALNALCDRYRARR